MEYLIFKTAAVTMTIFAFLWMSKSLTHSLYNSTNYLDVLNLRWLSSHIFSKKLNHKEVNQNLDKKRKDLIEKVKPRIHLNWLGSYVNEYSHEDMGKINAARNISNTKLAFNQNHEEEMRELMATYKGIANKKFGGLTVKNILDMEIAEEIAEAERKLKRN